MLKRLKKISEETIHENPWWVYKHDVYEKPNGEEGDYYYAETNGMVMVVPVMSDGRIVMVLQYRYLEDKQSVEFPAGGIKEGADKVETAKAELWEETGCVAEDFVKLGVLQPANGYTKDMSHIFITNVIEQQEQHLDDTEDIEVIFRWPDEIDEMIRHNDIWDGQTMATWAMTRHRFLE